MRRVLAIDLGGTKTALALYEVTDDEVRLVRTRAVSSASASGIEPIITEFLAGDVVEAAALGVAGPVRDGIVKTTNLPWVVSREALVALLGTPRVTLMNDVEAATFGAAVVAKEHCHVLHEAERDPEAPSTLVMIGTGFGRATLSQGHVLPSEGGHVSFAPRTSREWLLREHLAATHHTSHVSVEHVLSGRGLASVHGFVAREHAATATSMSATELRELAETGDAVALDTVTWFVSIIGSVLSDIALGAMCRGGLYLAGGVAHGLGPYLHRSELHAAYLDKPPMRELVEAIPLTWLDTPGLGLLGARTVAMRGH